MFNLIILPIFVIGSVKGFALGDAAILLVNGTASVPTLTQN